MTDAAPEILTNSRHYDGASADVWSAGVMLFVSSFETMLSALPNQNFSPQF